MLTCASSSTLQYNGIGCKLVQFYSILESCRRGTLMNQVYRIIVGSLYLPVFGCTGDRVVGSVRGRDTTRLITTAVVCLPGGGVRIGSE